MSADDHLRLPLLLHFPACHAGARHAGACHVGYATLDPATLELGPITITLSNFVYLGPVYTMMKKCTDRSRISAQDMVI